MVHPRLLRKGWPGKVEHNHIFMPVLFILLCIMCLFPFILNLNFPFSTFRCWQSLLFAKFCHLWIYSLFAASLAKMKICAAWKKTHNYYHKMKKKSRRCASAENALFFKLTYGVMLLIRHVVYNN